MSPVVPFSAARLPVAIGLLAVILAACAPEAAPPSALPTVTYAHVVEAEVTPWETFAGRLDAADAVEVRARVAGEIRRVHFTEGALVRAGQLLAEVDPRPYAAALKEAEARLAMAHTRAAQAAADAGRADRLLAVQAISKEEGDARRTASESARAEVRAAEAAVATAALQLEWTRIIAPISGRVSRALVKPGNLVDAGAQSAPVTTIVTVDPLTVALDVDERAYLQYVRSGSNADALKATLELADGTVLPEQGRIAFVDNAVDATSGTIRLHAVFPNRDGRLAPGLFARVKLQAGRAHRALVVPEAAVGIDQDRRYVLVMQADSTLESRPVKLGAADGRRRIVLDGVKAGEAIVVAGQQRVRPGMKVIGQHAMPETSTLAAR